jgi:hypothetical protein
MLEEPEREVQKEGRRLVFASGVHAFVVSIEVAARAKEET